jgi:hypothetical protein
MNRTQDRIAEHRYRALLIAGGAALLSWTVASVAALLIVGTAIVYCVTVGAGILASFVLVSDRRLALRRR